jgi:hypothetical protein
MSDPNLERQDQEPDLGEVNPDNTYLPEMVPDSTEHPEDLKPGKTPTGNKKPDAFPKTTTD